MTFLLILEPLQAQIQRHRAVHHPQGPLESFIFLRNFNDFPPHTEGHSRLRFCGSAPWTTPAGPLESFIFLRNFNDFAAHTEGHSRLRFCACAWCLTPQDLWNPLFS